MKTGVLYLKIEQNTEILNKKIFLGDFAKLYSTDNSIVKDLNQTIFWTVRADSDTKYMFSVMKVIETIQKKYMGIQIINMGEKDFILSYKVPKSKKKWTEYTKGILVALTAFFGGAISIMTFNTDVSVGDVFGLTYKLVLGQEHSGAGILEISYSVGLALGILIFYNHFFRKAVHDDPTPIQVEMRKYEEELNKALIQDAAREGKTIDAN